MPWVSHASPEVDAISQWRTIIAICTVLSILSMVVVFSRLWISFRGRGLSTDDYMSLLSVVFALIYSILTIVQTKYGLGLPIKLRSQDPGDASVYKKVNFAGRPIYQLGISFFKIALLLSYLRLLQGTDKRTYRLVVWISIGAVFIGHFGSALALIFACTPVSFSWELVVSDPHPTCVNLSATSTIYSAITIASDIWVALLPIPVLVKLKIPRGKKMGLVGVFLLGFFTTICSILRLVQLNRISYGDGNSTMLVLWGTIEFNVGNMVSSLPFLAPVFLRKARDLSYRRYQSSYGDGSSGNRPGLRSGEHLNLSSMGHHKKSGNRSAFASAATGTNKFGSEENILPSDGIVKSVEYTVRVEEQTKDGTHKDTWSRV